MLSIGNMASSRAVAWVLSMAVHHGFANDMAECVEDFATNMLQLEQARVALHEDECGHLLVDRCDPQANYYCSNNCRFHSHRADCYRPVEDVMAEHPGVDGYCWFNGTAGWLMYAGPDPNFEAEAVNGILVLRDPSYKGLNTGKLITFRNFEGVANLTTYADCSHYIYDDLYAYSLGFLQGQGLDPAWMKNSSLWMALSKNKCDEIQATYNFSKEELVLADWLDWNPVIAVMTMCTTDDYLYPGSSNPEINKMAGWRNIRDCRPVTHRDFAKHHYVPLLPSASLRQLSGYLVTLWTQTLGARSNVFSVIATALQTWRT